MPIPDDRNHIIVESSKYIPFNKELSIDGLLLLCDKIKYKDCDIWDENASIITVIQRIMSHAYANISENIGFYIDNENVSYVKIFMPEPSADVIDLSWIKRLKKGRKLCLTAVGYLYKKGFSCIRDFFIDEYLMQTASDYIDSPAKEDVEYAKQIMCEIEKEEQYISYAQYYASKVPYKSFLKSFKRTNIKEPVKRWLECCMRIYAMASSVDKIAAGAEEVDIREDNTFGINFCTCFSNDIIKTEFNDMINTTLNESGYAPGIELSSTKRFNMANECYHKLIELNYECLDM